MITEKQVAGTNDTFARHTRTMGQCEKLAVEATSTNTVDQSLLNREQIPSTTKRGNQESLLPHNRAADTNEHTLVQGGRNGGLVYSRIVGTYKGIIPSQHEADGSFSDHHSDPPSDMHMTTNICMEDISCVQLKGNGDGQPV